jgi:uncharacterized membrane protein HdeD (DUF308 family)
MEMALARNWWVFGLRGILAVAFGLIALAVPGAAMLSLVLVFAAYAFVDGVFAIVSAVRAAGRHERWMLFVFEGIVGMAAGILAVAWPAITIIVFVTLVAIWALLTGAMMLIAAFHMDAAHGRWWLALGGVASVIYGALLIIMPMIGALVLTWWIGAYAIVFGFAMLVAALHLRGRLHAGGAA